LSRSDEQRLTDIIEAAREVLHLVSHGKDAWDADRVKQLAVERLLEIIGEAARALSDEAQSRYDEVEWRDIIGLRTVLAHHYHRVDPEQVWVIASVEIPKLLDELSGGGT
jgi:uncharacterized protein with HEPN domain